MEPKDRNNKTAVDPKEAKLAAALRANLRRRKAGAPETPKPKNQTAD